MLVVSSRGIKLLWVFRLIHVREYEFWISGNFCSSNPDTQQIVAGNPESLALESEIQLKESTIPLSIGFQNPSSTDKDSEIPGVGSRSKTVLDSFTWGGSGDKHLRSQRTPTC